MRVLIDTNRYRDFCEAVDDAVHVLRRAERVFLPFVSLAELRAGFRCGRLAQRNASVLTRFLGRPRVGLLFPDEETTHHYAGLFAQLRAQGTPIPTNDLWIAALVSQHDLCLYSRDAHFDHLPQLNRLA